MWTDGGVGMTKDERPDALGEAPVVARFTEARARARRPVTLEEVPLSDDIRRALAAKNDSRAAISDALIGGIVLALVLTAIFAWALGGLAVGIPTLVFVAGIGLLMGAHARETHTTLQTEAATSRTLLRYTGPLAVERNDGEALVPYCWIQAGTARLQGDEGLYRAARDLEYGAVEYSPRGLTVVAVRDDAGEMVWSLLTAPA
jgi:hypothetical protein